jgi:hypothetical protein
MHEIRQLVAGDGPRQLVAAKKPTLRNRQNGSSLAVIPIHREESRKTNQRREDRHVNLVDEAEIIFRRKRIEVAVRNVSGHGVMIEADIEPRLGERIDIRFADCNRTHCSVRWIKGRQIGLEFAEHTVLIASANTRELIISGRRAGEQPAALEMKPERPPRHSLVLTGTLHYGIESMAVRLHNISASGAMLDGGVDVMVGRPVVLELAGGGAVAVEGSVRWCLSGQVGLLFDKPFDMRLLAGGAAPEPKVAAARYVKPDYLTSECDDESPWAARTYGLRHEDL